MNRRQKKKFIHKMCIRHQDGCGLMTKVFFMSDTMTGHTFNSYASYLKYKTQTGK